MKYSLLFSVLLIPLIVSCKLDKPETLTKETVLKRNTDLVSNGPKISADTLSYCLTGDNVGAGGNDLVNYFDKNSAKSGLENIQSTYDGVVYRFLHEENKLAFESNPEKYLPAFGGWCSMTLAMGNATVPKYDNFKVLNGRLYLFERTLSVNGQSLWLQDTIANNQLATENYTKYIEDGIISLDN